MEGYKSPYGQNLQHLQNPNPLLSSVNSRMSLNKEDYLFDNFSDQIHGQQQH